MDHSKKTGRKRFVLVALSFLVTMMIFMTSIPVAAVAEPVPIEETGGDVFEWRYKMENGILWKRLYNVSLGYWVTEWEPIL